MNQIKALQKINETELENGILKTELSWHHEYRDQAYIFIGGLNADLTEADVLTIFSQYGVPVDIFLVRDKDTGNSKGFAYLKYEDQRSTVLAIDNLNGYNVAGRVIKVDHAIFTPNDHYWQYREAVRQELLKDKVISESLHVLKLKDKGDPDDLGDPIADYSKSN